LRQVLVNLLSNAVKFTHEGYVRLRVGLPAGPEPDPRTVTCHFSVEDSGIGVPEAKRDLIFESFQQADGSITRQYGGTGLGLAICRKLVEKMNGRIWVESGPAGGSNFQFTARFGLASAPARSESSGPDASEGQPGERFEWASLKGRRILLAEDNPVNQRVVKRMLEKEGCVVEAVGDGQAAIAAWQSARFDIVLMDVQMPVLDGSQAAARIRGMERATGAHTPILALTAHAMKGDRERCLDAGMDDYVAKPVQRQKLLSAIGRLVAPPPLEAVPRREGCAAPPPE
jgi:CheY-like chemotaxis protein